MSDGVGDPRPVDVGPVAGPRWLRVAALAVSFLIVLPLIVLGWQTTAGEPRAGTPAAEVNGADLIRALELPRAAQSARAAGIAESDLERTLRVLQSEGVRAGDAGAVLSAYLRLGLAASGESLAPHVEERLAAGVRGPGLAEALRALRRALPAPDSTRVRAPVSVPRDSAGERRPLRDTMRLPPVGPSERSERGIGLLPGMPPGAEQDA